MGTPRNSGQREEMPLQSPAGPGALIRVPTIRSLAHVDFLVHLLQQGLLASQLMQALNQGSLFKWQMRSNPSLGVLPVVDEISWPGYNLSPGSGPRRLARRKPQGGETEPQSNAKTE